METTGKTSLEAPESGNNELERCPSSQSGSLQHRRMTIITSSDMTTAMGGTIDNDLDHTLLGESKESEENMKDVLQSKIVELETKLKQTDDYYEKLTKEVTTAKELYEKEREECEDVVSVAKRNIENQVSKILDLQKRKRELAEKIQSEEERLMKEEEETRVELKSEEERLTRNIVVLQTKLLINEGIKFERDQLLSRIKGLETDLVKKEKFYQKELQNAKDKIQDKYDRLSEVADMHKNSIAEQVKDLSLRQQIAALKHAQEQIVRIQFAYKKTSRKMLQLIDQNKVLRERNHNMEVQVATQTSLIESATTMSKELKMEYKESFLTTCSESSEEVGIVDENQIRQTKEKIDELKYKLFKGKDEERELNEVLEDQRNYLNIVRNQKELLHDVEQRLVPLADLAEHIVQKGKVVFKKDTEDSDARHEIFQKLSAILSESEELQKYMSSSLFEQESDISEKGDFEGLSPVKEEDLKKIQTKSSHVEYSNFTRNLDEVEKKILSDLGLLGKYGSKQKKYIRMIWRF